MKLEDINKENIFGVPDHYFDDLPLRIQERIRVEKPDDSIPVYRRVAFQYALPVIIVLLLVTVVFRLYFRQPSPEKLISEVPTEALIAYLESTDITEDELLNDLNASVISGDFFEEEDPGIIPDDLDPHDIDLLLNAVDSTNDYF